MTCASCVARDEKSLLKVPGVTSASVNLATERATGQLSDTSNVDGLFQAIEKARYKGQRTSKDHHHDHSGHQHQDEGAAVLRRDTLIAGIITLPLFVLEMLGHLYMPFHMWLMSVVSMDVLWTAYFIATSVVLFVPGWRFFKIGIPALLRGAPEMNSLVALGSGAAYLYSVVATFAPQLLPEGTRYIYYEAAAVIVTLILVGRWLEALAKGRTGEAIQRLVREQAKTARVQRDGQTVELPVEQVV